MLWYNDVAVIRREVGEMPETAREQTVARVDHGTGWLGEEQCDGDPPPPMPPKRTCVVRGRIIKVFEAEPVGVELPTDIPPFKSR